MANTYFKYAERNAENRINWAEVGKDMTDMLSEEARVRQEKKAAIETDFRDFNQTLADSPVGESNGFNEFTTDYANSASEYSLMINNMLKSGDLKLRDYNSINANLKQGTAEAFSIAEDYNAAYKGMLERGEIDPATGLPAAQLLEQYVLGTAQGFGNFSNHRLWINPATGRVSLGTTQTDENGNVTMNRDTGSFIAVNALRNRTKAKYDIYDMEAANTKIVSNLGKTVRVIRDGTTLTLSDATQNPDVVKALDAHAESVTAIPTNVSSILTNSVVSNPNTGDNYGFTDNPAEAAANENLILLMDNPLQPSSPLPMPAFLDSPKELKAYLEENFEDLSYTDDEGNYVSHSEAVAQIVENNTKQEDEAKKAVRISVLSKIDKEETAMPVFDPQRNLQFKAEAAENLRIATAAVTNLADVWWGNESEMGSALGFLQGLDDKIVKFYIDPNNPENVLIDKTINGKTKTMIPFPKGDSVVDFVTRIYTTLVPGGKDLAQALKDSGIGNEMEADGVTPKKKTAYIGAAGTETEFKTVLDWADKPKDSDNSLGIHFAARFKPVKNGGGGYGGDQASAETYVLSTAGITGESDFISEDVLDGAREKTNNNPLYPGYSEYGATRIFVPGAMSMPIMVPENQPSNVFESITKLIISGLKEKPPKIYSPNDFKKFFSTPLDFEQYNNQTMTNKILTNFNWDGGVGSSKGSTDGTSSTSAKTTGGGKKKLPGT